MTNDYKVGCMVFYLTDEENFKYFFCSSVTKKALNMTSFFHPMKDSNSIFIVHYKNVTGSVFCLTGEKNLKKFFCSSVTKKLQIWQVFSIRRKIPTQFSLLTVKILQVVYFS